MKKTKNLNSSLWNINKNKIRYVREYINELKPFYTWELHQEKFFNDIIKSLNNETDANKILERIGYRYEKIPLLYDEINKEGIKNKN